MKRYELSQRMHQDQRLIMSFAMQRAFKVLQMPIQTLAAFIECEIASNPLLEHAEKCLPSNAQDFTIPFKTTLYEHLLKQIHPHFNTIEEKGIAEILIGYLDKKGFLTDELYEICKEHQLPLKLTEHVLKDLHHFDPVGIGAKDVRMTLMIQLEVLGKIESLGYEILKNHFQDLIEHRLSNIEKKLKISKEELKTILQKEISTLQPHPGYQFLNTTAPAIIPDVIIDYEEDRWNVDVNEKPLPHLKVAPKYLNELSSNHLPSQERDFMRKYLASSNWLFRILGRRKKTLRDITRLLIQKQGAYLNGEHNRLVPMTMREIAEILELNESTIARAIADKYIASPRGLLKMRHFFTHKLNTPDGEKISNQTAKDLLIKLIEQEDKSSPLTDDAISSRLKQKGIPCARRTIAKYRKQLSIAPAYQRKHWSN